MRTHKRILAAFLAAVLGVCAAVPAMAEEDGDSAVSAPALEIRTFLLQDYDSDTFVSYGSGKYQQMSLSEEYASRWPALKTALEAYFRDTSPSLTMTII